MSLPTSAIGDNTFFRAGALGLPVSIRLTAAGVVFILPSATRPELTRHHKVTFNDLEQPHEFACSCEAFSFGQACHAAARALEVLQDLAGLGVTLGRETEAQPGGGPGTPLESDEDPDAAVEHAVRFGGPLPVRAVWNGRFENCRTPRAPEPEGDLVAPRTATRRPGVRPGDAEVIVCTPGAFKTCARLQETVNEQRRAMGMRPVVYVLREEGVRS